MSLISVLNDAALLFKQQRSFDKAALIYEHINSINDAVPEVNNNYGHCYMEMGLHAQAIQPLSRAIKLRPSYVGAILNLVSTMMMLKDPKTALEICRQGIADSPDPGRLIIAVTSIYIQMGNIISGADYVRSLINRVPDETYLHAALGRLAQSQGNLDEAAAYFESSAENPELLIDSVFYLSSLKQIAADDKLTSRLLEVSRQPKRRTSTLTSNLHLALWNIYDNNQSPAEAFKHLTLAMRSVRENIDYNIDADIKWQRDLVDSQIALMGRKQVTLGKTPKIVFIVGMPRSGSTLIDQILSSHPDVYSGGEVDYLMRALQDVSLNTSDKIRTASEQQILEVGKKYLEYVVNEMPRAKMVYVDKMLQNYLSIGLIRASIPHARVIHAKRRGISTCLSCMTTHFIDRGKTGVKYSYDQSELGRYYLFYRQIMSMWEDKIETGFLISCDYEQMVIDQRGETKRILNLIGLNWDEACFFFEKNQRSVHTASFTQVRRKMYSSSIERWKRYERQLKPLIDMIGIQ